MLLLLFLAIGDPSQRESQIEGLHAPKSQAHIVDKTLYIMKPAKGLFTIIGPKEKASLYLKKIDGISKIGREIWLVRESNLKDKKELLKISKNLPPIYPLYQYRKTFVALDNTVTFRVAVGKERTVRKWLKEHGMGMEKNQFFKRVWSTDLSDDPKIINPFDCCNLLRGVDGIEWAEPSMQIMFNKVLD